ncbi:MAG: hypothetical protein II399_00345 [Lachnospiraceae bacterium]|nr:hypothetical protein [Lachnospiraceae bacterium]
MKSNHPRRNDDNEEITFLLLITVLLALWASMLVLFAVMKTMPEENFILDSNIVTLAGDSIEQLGGL